jgi:hypothetical protein
MKYFKKMSNKIKKSNKKKKNKGNSNSQKGPKVKLQKRIAMGYKPKK